MFDLSIYLGQDGPTWCGLAAFWLLTQCILLPEAYFSNLDAWRDDPGAQNPSRNSFLRRVGISLTWPLILAALLVAVPFAIAAFLLRLALLGTPIYASLAITMGAILKVLIRLLTAIISSLQKPVDAFSASLTDRSRFRPARGSCADTYLRSLKPSR